MLNIRVMALRSLRGFLLFTLLFLITTGHSAGSGAVILEVEIEPGFSIDVPGSLIFPAAAPGESVEQIVEVTVWANTEWDLTVVGDGAVLNGQGEEHDMTSLVEVQDYMSSWRGIDTYRMVKTSMPLTGDSGTLVSIPFRFTGDYGDPPGVYQINVQFTVVPQI